MQPPNGYIAHIAYMAFATGQDMTANPYRGIRGEWARAWDDSFTAARTEATLTNWKFTPAAPITYESSGNGQEVLHWRAEAWCGHTVVLGVGKSAAEAETALRVNVETRVWGDRREGKT